MNRTLRRPMFRRGGSAEGITSGLDKPKRGLVDEPGGYAGDPFTQENLLKQYETAKNVSSQINPNQGTDMNRFLINLGLDLVSRPKSGNIFQQVATSAKQPTADLYETKDRNDLLKRQTEGDIFKAIIEGQSEAAGGGGKTYRDIIVGDEVNRLVSAIADADAKLANPETTDAERATINTQLKADKINLRRYEKDDPVATFFLKSDKGAIQLLKKIKTDLFERNPKKYKKGQEDVQLILDSMNVFRQTMGSGTYNTGEIEKKADGGRIEYNIGGDVEPMQPQMQPQMPAADISYDQLRARLPQTVGDDIVELLSVSAESLEDFATIQTQQDVDNFNTKHNVNLVLPAEA